MRRVRKPVYIRLVLPRTLLFSMRISTEQEQSSFRVKLVMASLSPSGKFATLILLLSSLSQSGCAQIDTSEWTTELDHQNMKDQLGIVELRPGRDGFAEQGEPQAFNRLETLANPWPEYPPLLINNDGSAVETARQWFTRRRLEVIDDLEREVIGRLPADIPEVQWQVIAYSDADTEIAGHPVTGRKLLGHIDNISQPALSVDIEMTVVTPTDASGPVPVLMMFGRSILPGEDSGRPPFAGGPAFSVPPTTEQLIAAGWGYALINPGSIQADNGAGLTKGIIGLVNNNQPRTPEDWGALRAWAWGAARGFDYLETLPEVDPGRIGIEGVSRYGKAALVTLAFEKRFALGLIGSSGAGGAAPWRRNFGEALENVTGSGEYHWVAGNFLKYGTESGRFGRMDAGDLPVDSHMLIALAAPRLAFISYGIPENGDALWVDQQGSYMAAVAASEVYALVGAKGLSDSNPYADAIKPPVNIGLVSGQLAWRQSDGGHEDRTNVPYFLEWANHMLGYHAMFTD